MKKSITINGRKYDFAALSALPENNAGSKYIAPGYEAIHRAETPGPVPAWSPEHYEVRNIHKYIARIAAK